MDGFNFSTSTISWTQEMENDGEKVLRAKCKKSCTFSTEIKRKRNEKGVKLGEGEETGRRKENKCEMHVENRWGRMGGLGLAMCSLSRSLDAARLGTARLNTANWFSTLPAPAVP